MPLGAHGPQASPLPRHWFHVLGGSCSGGTCLERHLSEVAVDQVAVSREEIVLNGSCPGGSCRGGSCPVAIVQVAVVLERKKYTSNKNRPILHSPAACRELC